MKHLGHLGPPRRGHFGRGRDETRGCLGYGSILERQLHLYSLRPLLFTRNTITISDTMVRPPQDSTSDLALPSSKRSIPLEVMTLICEYLAQDTALRTLANVQSTSSAIHALATSFLYRTVIVDEQQACKLFGLFGDISPTDRQLFYHPVPPVRSLMDLHLAHRLRTVLSHVEELVLELRWRSHLLEEQTARVLPFRKIVEGLAIFDHATLWPSIERCRINMNVRGHPGCRKFACMTSGCGTLDQQWLRPDASRPVIEAMFAGIYSDHLSIILPPSSPSKPLRKFYNAPPETPYERTQRMEADNRSMCASLGGLRANHIEIHGFLSMEHALPIATSSLVVYFAESWEWSEPEEPTLDVPDRLRSLLDLGHLYRELDTITIWNSMGSEPSEDMDYYMYDLMWFQIDTSTMDLVPDRVAKGNSRELQITIMPAGYVEGGQNEVEPSTEIFAVSLCSALS
jgi:hypothetical protein